MPDGIKDYAEWIIAGLAYVGSILLGFMGLGKLMQRVAYLEDADDDRRDDEPVMSVSSCTKIQANCSKIQCLKHEQYKTDIKVLAIRITDNHKESTNQYNNIIKLLLTMNGNSK